MKFTILFPNLSHRQSISLSPLPLSLPRSSHPKMARTKTKRLPYSSASASAAATASRPRTTTAPSIQNRNRNQNQNQNQNQTQNQNQEEEDEKKKSKPSSGGHLVSLLTSAISLSLRFLSDSDLLLPPSSALTLSSLLRSSALSLSSLISLLRTHQRFPNVLPLLPPPSRPLTTTPFPWFRRFLASSSSPSDPRWLHNFRMSKPSFYLLLQTLSPSLLPLSSSTSFPSSPIPADHKLAAALFRLAHAAPFPFVARRFGLNSPSLAARAFYETLRAVADHLSHLFELSSDTPRILHAFNWLSLPNCCGVLSFSRFGSLIAQCLVDSEGRFLDVSVGWHGSMSPEEILPKTKLFAAQAAVLGGGRSAIELKGGVSVPRYFIAGSCCPMLPWLLTPYKDLGDPGLLSSASSKAAVFNTVHARGTELADRAFARLRARWKLLTMEWSEECVEALPYVVVASCLLHNYLVKCSEPVPEEVERCGMEMMGFKEFEGKGDEEGERIRDVIASHLSQVIHK